MTESTSEHDQLSERVVKLERANRRLSTALTGLVVVLGLAVSAGARNEEKATTADRVEAKAFILKDDAGKTRAELQMGSWGTRNVRWEGPQLVLFDTDGRKRMALNYEKQVLGGGGEHTQFQFFDKDGEAQLGANTVSDNGPVIFYLNHKDGARVNLSAHPKSAEIELWHNPTYPAAGATMFATKTARGIHVNDVKIGPVVESKKELDMYVEDGKARITVYDEDGNPVFSKP